MTLTVLGAGGPQSGSGPIIYLKDSFTDADNTNLSSHTMDIGPGWTANVSDFASAILIISNKAELAVGNLHSNEYQSDSSHTEVTVSATLNPGTTAAGVGTGMGIGLRGVDEEHNWLVYYYGDGMGTFSIFEKVPPGGYNAKSTGISALSDNTDYTLTFTASGTLYTATLNGVQITYTSSDYQTGTLCTIHLFGGSSISGTIDNYLATP